ncbi:hypothetical protein MPH48_06805 [Lysinibacillus fusiformis]|uniref:hypothetical protein n=1 Tax=Lysinibacillus fusiformis TaxID=28031 RepID=UPI001F4F0C13|nr:hypothetical protein [Lysinibacillus fusiformis]MCK1987818.1 hypothetical protein [Lysinibacillus fusiformis]
MKKEIGTLLLLSTVIFSGCQSDQKEERVSKETHSPTHIDTTLIGASDNQEVRLYKKGDGVKLEINGHVKDFNWNNPSDTGTEPQVFYIDMTEDGKEEAVIIIQTGRGTGLDNYDIHIVDQDLQEIKVPYYEEIVAQHIESNVVKKDHETLTITGRALGKEYHFDYHVDPELELQQDELGFGGITIYYLENQKIQLTLAASVFPIYVADFHITYKYNHTKNEFMIDQIEVAPIQQ